MAPADVSIMPARAHTHASRLGHRTERLVRTAARHTGRTQLVFKLSRANFAHLIAFFVGILLHGAASLSPGDCGPGRSWDGASCRACPQGTFKTPTDTFCVHCPNIGAYSSPGSNSSLSCVGGRPAPKTCMSRTVLEGGQPHLFWRPLETNTDLTWHVLPGGLEAVQRYGHTVVNIEEFVILFGGRVTDGVGYDAWGHDDDNVYVLDAHLPRLTWRKISMAASSDEKPSGRYFHSALLHDSKMILFGGKSTNIELRDLSSLWALDVSTFQWERVETKGFGPHSGDQESEGYQRYGHTSAMLGDKIMILFGGKSANSSSCLSDVWALDTESWVWEQKKTAGIGPSGLCFHSSIVVGRSMVVLGGYSEEEATVASEVVWELDTKTWTWAILSQSADTPSSIQSAIVFEGEITVLSGTCQAQFGCSMFRFNANHTWQSIGIAPISSAAGEQNSKPIAVAGKAQQVVALSNQILILGGASQSGFSSYIVRPTQHYLGASEALGVSEVFFLPDQRRSPKPHPSPRERSAAAVVGDALFIFGGLGTDVSTPGLVEFEYFSDTWRLDLRTSSWQEISAGNAGPIARHGHTVVANGTSLVLFAGSTALVSPGAWLACRTCTSPAATRDQGYSALNDVWVLEEGAASWTSLDIKSTTAPPHREGHVAVLLNTNMVVFGGVDFSLASEASEVKMFDDVWTLDLDTLRWNQGTVVNQGPGMVFHHAAVTYGERILVLGGCRIDRNGSLHFLNAMWALHDTGEGMWEWEILGTSGMDARAGHSALLVGSSIVLFGGYRLNEHDAKCAGGLECLLFLDDAWKVWTDLAGNASEFAWQWTKIEVLNPPTPRAFHVAVMTGPDYFMMGGGKDWIADGHFWKVQYSESASLPISNIVRPGNPSIYLTLAMSYMSVLLPEQTFFSGARIRAAHVLVEPRVHATRAHVDVGARRTLFCVGTDGCSDLVLRSLDIKSDTSWRNESASHPLVHIVGAGVGVAVLNGLAFTGIQCRSKGCSITIEDGATARLHSVFCHNGSSSSDGGCVAVIDAHMEASSCKFENSASGDKGGAIAAISSLRAFSEEGLILQTTIVLHSTIFHSNVAQHGGGALSCGASASCNVSTSIFVNNQAQGVSHGGAILSKGHIRITGSVFDANTARRGAGGAIFWQDIRPDLDLDDQMACKNMDVGASMFGPCVASNAMHVLLGGKLGPWEMRDQIPGVYLEPILRVTVVDFYNQTVVTGGTNHFPAHVHVENRAHAVLQGATSVVQAENSSEFAFWDLRLLLAYSSVQADQAVLSSKAISLRILVDDFSSGRTLRAPPLNVSFDSCASTSCQTLCPEGQVLQLSTWDLSGVGGVNDTLIGACKSCPPTSYTLFPLYGHDENGKHTPGRPSCISCPRGARCDGGSHLEGIGSWTVDGGEYRLESCPPGYARMIGGDNGGVEYHHNQQQCRKCRTDGVEYVLNSNVSSNGCQLCPAGLVCFGSSHVEPRMASNWKVEGNYYLLENCTRGHFPFRGSNGFDAAVQRCLPCPQGQACADDWCSSCTLCQPGTYKLRNDPGTVPDAGCHDCPVGTYNPSEGSTSRADCVFCPVGSSTKSTGRANVSDCHCEGRLYRHENSFGEISCVSCPKGATCDDGSCALNPLATCNGLDKLVGSWIRNSNSYFSLARCPAGHNLVSKVDGVFEHDEQSCVPCRPAVEYVINSNTDGCKPCPPGLACLPVGNGDSPFQMLEEKDLLPIQMGSLAAPENVRPYFNESSWRIDGDVWVLERCPQGYHVSNDSIETQHCTPCGLGEHCDDEDSCVSCSPCPLGTYKDSPGSYKCRSCPLGTYGETQGSTNASQCIACPGGAITKSEGATNASQCFCSSLDYKSVSSSADPFACLECPLGAVCGELSNFCAFNVDPPGCGNASIIGNWKREPTTGSMVLVSCPDAHELVNSSVSGGKFVSRLQQCVPCSQFEYVTDPNRFRCQGCPPGLECNGSSSVHIRLSGSEWVADGPVFRLQSCPRGYKVHNSTIETQECQYCGVGEHCVDETCVTCSPCPLGSYKDSTSASACKRCAIGSYAPSQGSRACTLCPQFSKTPGTNSTSRLACLCEGATYHAGGPEDFVCETCPRGGVCPGAYCALSSNNLSCADGKQIIGVWNRNTGTGQFQLQSCPAGYSLVNSLTGTSDGVFFHDGQYCQECSPNWQYVIDPNTDACQDCPPGLTCGDGTDRVVPKLDGSEWVIQDDHYRLVSCPTGYRVFNGESSFAQSVQECVPCPAGSECTLDTCTECSKCSAGMYKDFVGALPCVPCPNNTFGRYDGATSLGMCTACPDGAVTVGDGRSDPLDCICEPRRYLVDDPETGATCRRCPVGASCPGEECALALDAFICPDNTTIVGLWTRNADNEYVVQACPQGHERINSITGTSDGIFSHDAQQCRPCLKSQYILDPSQDQCQPCPSGLTCSGGADVVADQAGANWTQEGELYKLQWCPAGHFVDAPSQVAQQCVPCEAGTHCPSAPCTACEPCPAGTFKASSGSYECVPCPLGTYLPTTGARSVSECKKCPDGAFTANTGETSEFSCECEQSLYVAGGEYGSEGGMFKCSTCPRGGTCTDGTCMFSNPGQNCSSGDQMVGNWSRSPVDGRYQLESCPVGFSLVNTTSGGSKGTYNHDVQACVACDTVFEYVVHPNTDRCQPCPPGLTCDGTASVRPVLDGSVWELCSSCEESGTVYKLTSCPTGYSVVGSPLGQQQCASCAAGTECLLDKCVQCYGCEAGYYKAAAGPVSCRPCPLHTYNPSSGSTALAACASCLRHGYTTGVGSSSPDQCLCGRGTYSSAPPGGDRVCLSCPRGATCSDASCAFERDPPSCPAGSEFVGNWERDVATDTWALVDCPAAHSLINSVEGTSSGTFSYQVQRCQKCSVQTYILEPRTDQCQPCPVGLICNGGKDVVPRVDQSTWVPNASIYRLESCGAGHEVFSGSAGFDAKQQNCIPCGPGTECPAAPCVECGHCLPGRYKDTVSSEPCELCPINTYSAVVGATVAAVCTSCPSGAVTQGTGHQELAACACLSQYYTVSNLSAGLLACVTCPDGAKCGDGSCALHSATQTCPEGAIVGTWRRSSGSLDSPFLLEACPDGFSLVNSTDGSSSGNFAHDRQRCQRCPSGDYIIDFMFECKRCQEGILCTGVKEVTPLVKGMEIVPIGDTYWLASCPTGYSRQGFDVTSISTASSAEIIQQACIPCQAGTSCSDERCIECFECLQGTYKESASPGPCQPCPLSTYSLSNGSTSRAGCRACPKGAVTLNLGETQPESCVCDPATYQTAGDVAMGEIKCSSCPQGALCADGYCAFRTNQTTCTGTGKIVGTWEPDENGDYFLKSCPPGYSLLNETAGTFAYGAQRCKRCLTTEYIIFPDAQKCQTCPEGLKCRGDDVVEARVPGSVWELLDGQYRLVSCPGGYLFETKTPAGQKCAGCPLGYECTAQPCMECTACVPGKYKDTVGPGKCTECDRDTFNPIYAATSAAECKPCPLYAATANRGSTRPGQCVCAMSTYIMDEQFMNSTGAWCKECPIGGECKDVGSDVCSLRMPDHACPGTSGTATGREIVGNWSRVAPGGEYRLTSCPSGFSLVTALDGTSTGFFWHGAQQCRKCEPGEHYILRPNMDTCQRCPPGLVCYGNESVTPVTNGSMWFVNESIYWLGWCPAGHSVWNGDPGDFEPQAQECRECPQGTVCHQERCTECSPCPAGQYKDARGDAPCRLCPNNTFSAQLGAASVGACAACPIDSTNGPGETEVHSCKCHPSKYMVDTPEEGPKCVFCPVGAMCPDGRTCAVNLPDYNCSASGTPIIGSWERSADDYFHLLSCPTGTSMINSTTGTSVGIFAHDIQQCTPCKTCPEGQTWCSQAEYVLDPQRHKCKSCPYGAACSGSQLRTVDSLDVLGANWRPDTIGALWITICPVGFRLMNHTGYENQHCKACPFDQYVYRPDHPRFQCHPCPAGATCLNGGPPVFGTEAVSSSVVVEGMVNDPSEFGSRQYAVMVVSLQQSVPTLPGTVEITEVCDANGQNCNSATRRRRRNDLMLPSGSPPTRSLQQTSSGVTVKFRVLSDSISPSAMRSSLARSDFSSTLSSTIAATDPTFSGVSIPAMEAPKFDAPPNSKGERYTIDSDGRANLWFCGVGYLMVNDTFSLQECTDCHPTTYSLHPLDYCDAEGICAQRECSRCPRGARCKGGSHFESIGGATWEQLYNDAVRALVYRVTSCIEGQLLVRIPELPAEDQCLECPAGSYALEATNMNLTFLRPAQGESVVGPLLCFDCPTGATCPGRLDVEATDGYWRGKDMICPNSRCTADGMCTPKYCENLPAPRQPGLDGDELWRMRAMIFPCRPRHCAVSETNATNQTQTVFRRDGGTNATVGNCRKGHRGLLCGECESGWAMTGSTCRYCGSTGTSNEGFGGVVVFAIVAFAVFSYFAAWRPLLQEYEDALLASCFPPQEDDGHKSWWARMSMGLHGSLTDFLKVLVSFFQVAGNFILKVNAVWPQDLLDYFLTIASAVQLDVFHFPGLSCVFDSLTYLERLQLMTLAIPIMIAFLAIPSVITRYRFRARQNACKNHCLYCSLFFLFITYHFSSRLVFEAFACVDLGVDGQWLKADVATECPATDSNKTTLVWAIISVVIYPVGTPLLMYGFLMYFGVNKSVEEKMNRSYMTATLEKFKLQNSVPLLLSKRLYSQVRNLERELQERIQAVKSARIQKMQDDGEDVSALTKDEEFKLGVDDLRELLAGLKIKDTVPHGELQGMIDRYGSQGTIVREEIIKMVHSVVKTRDVLTGDEHPDELNVVQLRKLCEAGQFQVANYAGSASGSKRDTHKRRRREDSSAEKMSYNLQAKEELVSLLIRRAKTMETKGELDIPEPTWDGVTKNERRAMDRVGFLFTTYRCRFWWFESLDLWRKILMNATGIFVFEGTPSQLAVGLLLTMLFLILSLVTKPFINNTIGNMHVYSLFVQAITWTYGIVLATGELDELAGVEGGAQRETMARMIIVINVLILVFPIIDRLLGLRPSAAQIRRFLIDPLGVPESWFGIKKESIPAEKKEPVARTKEFVWDEFLSVVMALRKFLRMRAKQAGRRYEEDPKETERLAKEESDRKAGAPTTSARGKPPPISREIETMTSPRMEINPVNVDSVGAMRKLEETMQTLDDAKEGYGGTAYRLQEPEPEPASEKKTFTPADSFLRVATGGFVSESGVFVPDESALPPSASVGNESALRQSASAPLTRGRALFPEPASGSSFAQPESIEFSISQQLKTFNNPEFAGAESRSAVEMSNAQPQMVYMQPDHPPAQPPGEGNVYGLQVVTPRPDTARSRPDEISSETTDVFLSARSRSGGITARSMDPPFTSRSMNIRVMEAPLSARNVPVSARSTISNPPASPSINQPNTIDAPYSARGTEKPATDIWLANVATNWDMESAVYPRTKPVVLKTKPGHKARTISTQTSEDVGCQTDTGEWKDETEQGVGDDADLVTDVPVNSGVQTPQPEENFEIEEVVEETETNATAKEVAFIDEGEVDKRKAGMAIVKTYSGRALSRAVSGSSKNSSKKSFSFFSRSLSSRSGDRWTLSKKTGGSDEKKHAPWPAHDGDSDGEDDGEDVPATAAEEETTTMETKVTDLATGKEISLRMQPPEADEAEETGLQISYFSPISRINMTVPEVHDIHEHAGGMMGLHELHGPVTLAAQLVHAPNSPEQNRSLRARSAPVRSEGAERTIDGTWC